MEQMTKDFRLAAEDAADLEVISAALQDAGDNTGNLGRRTQRGKRRLCPQKYPVRRDDRPSILDIGEKRIARILW